MPICCYWGFLFNCIERSNELRFSYSVGSFMIKMMSFKRIIRSSCKVEPCNTKHEIDLPNKVFFQ